MSDRIIVGLVAACNYQIPPSLTTSPFGSSVVSPVRSELVPIHVNSCGAFFVPVCLFAAEFLANGG